MASRSSSSSSRLFIGSTHGSATDPMELMINSQPDPNPMLPTSIVPAPANQVMTLSPTSLLDSKKYICEVCSKGFARYQNLVLHGRTHSLPYSLKSRRPKEPQLKKKYVCPEPKCGRHSPARALGDYGGLKKHYLRKHCDQRNYKCDTCSKAYTVETDLRAHLKTCGKKRGYNFFEHTENCVAKSHEAAAKHLPPLYMADGNFSRRGNILGSTTSPPPRFELSENSSIMTTNDNTNTLIGSNIFSIQNPPNTYQSPFGQYATDYGSLMTNRFSMGENPPYFNSPSPTQQNHHGLYQGSETRFYADLLRDKIPSNFENLNIMGEGSNSFSANGFTHDHSSSLYPSPAENNTGLNNGMLSTGSGYTIGESSSTINQSVGGNYERWGYNGYGNGYGNGQYEYGGGSEEFNYATSAATPGTFVPPEERDNQHGFWF